MSRSRRGCEGTFRSSQKLGLETKNGEMRLGGRQGWRTGRGKRGSLSRECHVEEL